MTKPKARKPRKAAPHPARPSSSKQEQDRQADAETTATPAAKARRKPRNAPVPVEGPERPLSELPKGATPEGFRRGYKMAEAMELLRAEGVKGKITFNPTRGEPPGRMSGLYVGRLEVRKRQAWDLAQRLDRTTAGPELVVNAGMLIVRLGDESCEFRKSAEFTAMVALARRPGVAVSGNRFAVSRLRRKLRDARLHRVAKAIVSKREGKYALDGSRFGSIEITDSPE